MIQTVDLHKSFGSKKVLDGVSATIHDHRITYIIGTSGTGKSVLVRHFVGLLEPDTGRVLIDGQDTAGYGEKEWRQVRSRYVLVFQHPALFDSMTLLENVAFPLRKRFKMPRREAAERAMHFLELIGMAQKASAMPAEVTPPEQKKVSVARALTLDPACAILDEPTTGLDVRGSRAIDELVMDLAREHGKTIVVVSHDLRSILHVADHILFLYKGRVWFRGTPGEMAESQDPVVRQFVLGVSAGPMEV